MTSRARLEGADRSAALAELPLWSEVVGRDAIERHFLFADFAHAFAFMSHVALLAEKVSSAYLRSL